MELTCFVNVVMGNGLFQLIHVAFLFAINIYFFPPFPVYARDRWRLASDFSLRVFVLCVSVERERLFAFYLLLRPFIPFARAFFLLLVFIF